MERIQFPEISPRAWEHPADRAALAALKKVAGLDELVKFFVAQTWERSERMRVLASAVRVTPLQFPRLHRLVEEACHVLDAGERPELYVTQDPRLNAYAFGVQRPFMAVHSSMIDTFDEDELLVVITHELAHIMSGHMLYRTLVEVLLRLVQLGAFGLGTPIPMLVFLGVFTALLEWYRKSELSADRAGLLVVQDPKVADRVLMKLAGGKHFEQMDQDEFQRQAEEYDSGGDILDGLYKLLNLLPQTHPFAALRLRALGQWVADGAYARIVAGDYPRRTVSDENVAHDFSEAQKAYEDELHRSKDPLARAVSDIGEGIENVRREAERFFGSLFGQK